MHGARARDGDVQLGTMLAGASRSVTSAAAVPADLVYNPGRRYRSGNGNVADRRHRSTAPTTVLRAVTAVAVADLSMASLTVDTRRVQMLTGENQVIDFSSVITSAGPSSPMERC